MASHLHKKFVRSKEPPRQFRIQPRDVEILAHIAEYRFLDTDQLLALHPGSPRNIRQRLLYLYQLGFVDRPASQKLLSKPGSPLIYAIGDKGAELLSGEEFSQRKEVAFPYLAHAMMISRFRSVLSLALEKHADKPELTRWTQGHDLKDLLSVRGERTELVPDAFFSIKDKGDMLHFFLEADRGTMTRERVLNKMKIYWQWWREGRCEKKLGISRFRVLVVAPGEERSENLRRVTKSADTRGEGSAMFLFAPEIVFSLKKPEAVLSPVWRSPKNNDKHALLE